MTVPKGRRGHHALNFWTVRMLRLLKSLTGVDARRTLNQTDATKLYNFLDAFRQAFTRETDTGAMESHSENRYKRRLAGVSGFRAKLLLLRVSRAKAQNPTAERDQRRTEIILPNAIAKLRRS